MTEIICEADDCVYNDDGCCTYDGDLTVDIDHQCSCYEEDEV